MKPKSVAPQSAVMAVDRKLHNTWVYIKRHWQLYLLFLMPAVLLTLVFRYIPMGGVLIAFQKYNPFKGIWGSEWVGFKNFTRFLSSPDFMRYLINTLKLSVYGLLWGFPIPILLAFLLNRIKSNKIKQKVQLVLYMPNFISVIVLCGIVRVLLSVTGPVKAVSYRHQLYDIAGGFPPDLHHQRNLAGRRLVLHYVHSRAFQRQPGAERSRHAGRREPDSANTNR